MPTLFATSSLLRNGEYIASLPTSMIQLWVTCMHRKNWNVANVTQFESASIDSVHVPVHALTVVYRYRMDAQHVICAGQVRHATRPTDATCHKSAEFRYMGRCLH